MPHLQRRTVRILTPMMRAQLIGVIFRAAHLAMNSVAVIEFPSLRYRFCPASFLEISSPNSAEAIFLAVGSKGSIFFFLIKIGASASFSSHSLQCLHLIAAS